MADKTRAQVVYSTPFFDLVAKPGSSEDRHPYYAIDTADYVSIVALTPNNEIVLVRHRRPVVDAEVLELPSGHVDGDETPTRAAARELREETGFIARDVELLGTLKPDTGRLANRMHVCFAANVTGPERLAEIESGIVPQICPVSELGSVLREGQFDHALGLAAVFLATGLGKIALPSFSTFRPDSDS